jgi:sugar (pentulose or hexulose) kinase
VTTFLGLDIGSSSIKGGILDLETMTVGKTLRLPSPDPVAGLPPGHFELDPMAVVATVQDLLEGLLPTASDCAGIVSQGDETGA